MNTESSTDSTSTPTKTRDKVKILLMQFRDDPKIRSAEYNSFVTYMKLRPDQVDTFDALTANPPEDLFERYDGLVVGGNGDTSVTDDSTHKASYLQLLKAAYDAHFPTLAVCFGAQLAALALGGNVETKAEMKETGTYPLYLTEEGKDHPLYAGLPSSFNGQMGHNDSITVLPEGAVRLTYSDRVENQAFYFPGKPFFAVQYHPELDAKQIRMRFEYYKDYYSHNMEEYTAILDNIKESTEASLVLERFVDHGVLGGVY